MRKGGRMQLGLRPPPPLKKGKPVKKKRFTIHEYIDFNVSIVTAQNKLSKNIIFDHRTGYATPLSSFFS